MSILVTGATGFLGKRIAEKLRLQGEDVLATGRNLEKGANLTNNGIRFQVAELTHKDEVENLFMDCEAVIHSAALSSPWGKYEWFYQANVVATKNLLNAAKERAIQRFVHISTPALYFYQGSRLNVKENAELFRPLNHYIATKRLAEEKIDEAFTKGLPVVTLRPRAIYGPGDTSILPRLIERLESGYLPIIGDGQNLIDLSYVDNVVDAALLALRSDSHVLGKKYNITNGEAVHLWDEIVKIADFLNLKSPSRKLSKTAALALAYCMEKIYARLPKYPEPPLTRYTVGLMAHSMTLDISAAQQDLNYKPEVSTQEGLELFLDWWQTRA